MSSAAWFHYSFNGDRTNPAVLFLHGFLGTGDDWNEVAHELSADFNCLQVDLPGHGETRTTGRPADYSVPETAEALLSLLDVLKIGTCSVVGYSMGGRLALHLAMAHPERIRRLVLESASPGLNHEDERAERRSHDERLALELESGPLEAFLRRWYEQPLFASLHEGPVRLEKRIASRLANDPRELARALRGMGTGGQASLWEKLCAFTVPTLLLVGERDAKYCGIAEEMSRQCPHCRIAVVPGCGHDVHFEKPAEYTRLVKDFLGEKRGRRDNPDVSQR